MPEPRWDEIMGEARPEVPPGSVIDIGRKLAVDIWSAPELSRRERRLITLTIISIVGDEWLQSLHVRAALTVGDLTPEELEAFLIHFAMYAGFPRAAMLNEVVKREVAARTAN